VTGGRDGGRAPDSRALGSTTQAHSQLMELKIGLANGLEEGREPTIANFRGRLARG